MNKQSCPRRQRSPHWTDCLAASLAIGILSICLVPGCQRGPALSKVQGQVKLDGKPLPQATVMFSPVDGGYTSLAETDAQGHYELRYSQGGSGAEMGKHRVTIETYAIRAGADGNPVEVPERLPARYNRDSTLEKELSEPAHELDFDLQSK